MNTRQVATGTVLTASLLLGGASLADASPGSRPAMDRGAVPCHALEHRLDRVNDHLDRLAHRRARLEAKLADAQADGDHRREHRLEIQLRQVTRAEARLNGVADGLLGRWQDQCAPVIPE